MSRRLTKSHGQTPAGLVSEVDVGDVQIGETLVNKNAEFISVDGVLPDLQSQGRAEKVAVVLWDWD